MEPRGSFSIGGSRSAFGTLDFIGEPADHRAIALRLGKRLTLFKSCDGAGYSAFGQECAGLAKELGVVSALFCWSHDR